MIRRDEQRADPGHRCALEFGESLRRLHRALGGAPSVEVALARAASRVWAAAGDGHVCLRLDKTGRAEATLQASDAVDTEIDLDRADLAAQMALSPVVGCPDRPDRPIIIDHERLYLHRLWRAECDLAQAVVSRDAALPLADPQAIDQAIASVFGLRDPDDLQQRAVACALQRRLTLLSGGPGTGKTTTLARLLRAVAALWPGARIAVAAPTGKAAARLLQALSDQIGQTPHDEASTAALPTQAYTLHRLLDLSLSAGSGAEGARFAPRILPFDLVIVDEASMLDIELARALMAALAPQTRLVLAGDQDQLASVEAGAVFAQLCAARLSATVRLERNHRQREAPALAELAAALREGLPGGLSDLESAFLALPRDAAAIATRAITEWGPVFDLLSSADPAEVLEAYGRHRILAALRAGPLGTQSLNRQVAAIVRKRVSVPAQAEWYPGRLVMITRNRADQQLFNGDVGVCLKRGDSLVVAIASGQGVRLLPLQQLPDCEDAWALTVHKSQGSEFESVALVLAPAGSPLAVRELVYTGATRARRRLHVWGDAQALVAAARQRSERDGLLAERIEALRRQGPAELLGP